MIVFGGWDGNETLSHILKYNVVENKWTVIDDAKGSIKGRYRHTAVCTEKAMYVFGGIDQEQERFNDIYQYQFENNTWTKVITMGNQPTKRTFHQSILYAGAYLFVIGGFDGNKRNDMFRIQLAPVSINTSPAKSVNAVQ